jgi:hypothetical protein
MEKKPPAWKREIDTKAGLVFLALLSAGCTRTISSAALAVARTT